MSIKEQVCSLELTKKLKEFGVKQESFCYWFQPNNAVPAVPLYGDGCERWMANQGDRPLNHGGVYSAFSAVELGESLPFALEDGEYDAFYLTATKRKDGWALMFVGLTGDSDHVRIDRLPVITSTTEADARAKMLIYLLTSGLELAR